MRILVIFLGVVLFATPTFAASSKESVFVQKPYSLEVEKELMATSTQDSLAKDLFVCRQNYDWLWWLFKRYVK